MSNNKKGFIYSAITVVLWGILAIKLKIVLEVMDPITITWYRLAFSGSALLIFFYSTKRIKISKELLSKHNSVLMIFATLGLLSNYVLYIKGVNLLAPSTAQVIMQISPMLMIVCGIFIFKEPLHLTQKFGIFVLVIGLLMFFNQKLKTLSDLNNSSSMGIFLTMFSAILWVVYGVAQKKLLLNKWSPAYLMMVLYLSSAILLFPFADPLSVFNLNLTQFIFLIACCLNTLIAYGTLSEAMNIWSSSKISAMLTIAPIIAYLSSIVVNYFIPNFVSQDDLNFVAIVGIFVVVIGSLLSLVRIKEFFNTH